MKTKLSLKDKLYNLIKAQGSLTYGEMCSWVAEEGYKVSTGERELRRLVEDETLNPRVDNMWKNSKRNKLYICGYTLKGEIPKKEVRYVIIDGEVKYL
jgi:ATP-dependent Clp protease ATP-binding subunit ClpA